MIPIKQTVQRILSFLRSEWVNISVLCVLLLLSVIWITIPRDAGSVMPPSMDTVSFSRWAYVIGLKNHGVFWMLCIFACMYWGLLVNRAMPGWKKQFSSFSESPGEKIDDEKKPLYFKEQFEVSHDLEFSAHRVKQELIRRGFNVREQQTGNEIYFSAEKHRIQRWATLIIYAGLACFIVGLVVFGLKGMREDVHAEQYSEEQILSEPLTIHTDNFNVRYYPNMYLLEGNADVSVFQHDQNIVQTIKLSAGTSVTHARLRYYLVDCGQDLRDAVVEVRMIGRRERTRILRLSFGEEEHIGLTPWIVRLEKFIPDFIIKDGIVTTRSNKWENPAILVSVFSGRKLWFKKWLFKNFDADPFFAEKESLFFKLDSLNTGNYFLMRISRGSGMYIIWVGMAMIIAGLFIMHVFSYQALWALIEDRGHLSGVLLAGEASRESINFPDYFKQVVNVLKGI